MLAKAMAAKPELIGKLSPMANLINHLSIAKLLSFVLWGWGQGQGSIAHNKL